MGNTKIKIGITQGDINGIGYEVILKTFQDSRILDFCTPILYGSSKVAAYHRKALNLNNVSFNSIRLANEAHSNKANIINCLDDNTRVELGKSTATAGQGSFASLERAVSDLKEGAIDALVTAPINKYNIQSEEFKFAGHTEYLDHHFHDSGALMLMVSDFLRVGVVAGHIPIAKLPEYITHDRILSKLRILNKSLIQDFGIRKPRIAVLGLNPHAGDNGVIGNEESTTIIPAMEKAKEENMMVMGPFPADGFFASSAYRKFDAILAMYHDQGLTPFKTITQDSGVNYTAGLNIVRTSPAHGTAYEIAGKGDASPDSFRQALYLAIDVVKMRQSYKHLTENPLKPHNIPGAGNDTVA